MEVNCVAESVFVCVCVCVGGGKCSAFQDQILGTLFRNYVAGLSAHQRFYKLNHQNQK